MMKSQIHTCEVPIQYYPPQCPPKNLQAPSYSDNSSVPPSLELPTLDPPDNISSTDISGLSSSSLKVLRTSNLPCEVICPYCNLKVTTKVERKTGTTAWTICLILCCFCFPFCIFPLVCDSYMDSLHICPECNKLIYLKYP